MTAYRVTTGVAGWLAQEKLLDAEVTLDQVRLHVGGPLSAYLRLVKKRAITLGDHVHVREAGLADQEVQANWPLYAHELVHVGQYRRMGIPKFLILYLRDMLKARLKYSRSLPLEAPAYERQGVAEERLGMR